MYRQILVLACGILVLAEPAAALRCGSKLVSVGAPQGKVRKYCGEPESARVRSVYRAGRPRLRVRGADVNHRLDQELLYADRAVVEVVLAEWTYNFGPRRLMRVIRFENGLVTAIEHLGYGY